MERLTKIYLSGSWGIDGEIDDAIHRLAAIEGILGDDYDLERLRELVEADRDGRCTIIIKCHECKYHGDSEEGNWCKFWHKYCPIDPDFYCKAALKIENNK